MDYKQNLHTHTTYCDGKDTPRQMVETAIKKGFNSIGFSGHSYMYYSSEWGMSLEGTEKYKKDIAALKEEYRDSIKIYCGIEYDMYSDLDISDFDYSIGSVHYLKHPDGMVDFDRSGEYVESLIDRLYGGDGYAYAEEYYRTLSKLPAHGKFDIIGHFDIINKHIETHNFFDVNSKRYLDLAFSAVSELKGKIPFFEVNTGAIARGYRTSPYPTLPILRELNAQGFMPIITSDCHDARFLYMKFDEAAELLRSVGFKNKFVLTDDGFKPIKL